MKKIALLLAIFAIGLQAVMAQTRELSGKVTSADGDEAIPGVSVSVKGTTLGTITNMDGVFRLKVPQDAKALIITFVGMKTQEVPIGTTSNYNVKLEPDVIGIQEVVVSGYGIKREAKSSSALNQTVTAEKLNVVRQTNVNNALAGKVSGIQLMGQSAAALNRTGEIRLRGASGFSTGTGVLYVVDGTVVQSASDINMDDVEDVSVLSGPSASAILGAQGADGAIIITTKKAKANSQNKLGIEVNSGIQLSSVYIMPRYQNDYAGGNVSDMYRYSYREGIDPVEWQSLDGKYYPDYSDDASWGPRMSGQEYIPWYSWYAGTKYSGTTDKLVAHPNNSRDFFQTGVTYNNNVSFNKAGEDYSIRVVAGKINVKGNIPTSSLNKTNLSIKTSYDLTKKLTVAANINLFTNKTNGEFDDGYSNQSTGSFNQWFHRDLDMKKIKELKNLRSPEGILASWNHNNPTAYDPSNPVLFYGGNYWYNFYTWFDNVKMPQRTNRWFGDVSLNYKIIEGLSAKITYRRQQFNSLYEEKFSSDLYHSQTQATGNEPRAKGYYLNYQSYFNRENLESLISYTKKFGNFKVNANAGTDFLNYETRTTYANTNNGLLIDNLYTISNSKDQPTVGIGIGKNKNRAVFTRGDIGYKDFLFGEFTLRQDWYSQLPPEDNGVLSKSIGASFVFSDLLKSKILNYGKIRASWGEIPQSIDTYAYPGFAYGVSQYKWGTNFLMGTPDQLVDPQIHGAVKQMKEIGFELRFFESKVGLTATYWDGTEKDIPYSVSISNYSGFGSKYLNTGEISKKGIDLALNLKPINTKNFSWELNGTFSYLIENKIVKIADGIDKFFVISTSWGTPLYHVKGMKWGQLFGSGKKMVNGQPILNTDGSYVTDPSQYFGSVLPDITGGLQNSFRIFKDFTFNANIDFQFGGKFFSLSDMWGTFSGLTARTSGVNDKGNPIRDAVADGGGVHVFGVDATDNTKQVDYYVDAQTYFHNLSNNKVYDEFLYSKTYVKLRELGLGYNVPLSKIGLSKYVQTLNLSVVAQNPWLIYAKTKDYDPSEISGTSGENGQFPGIRSFGFNLKASF